MGKSRTVTLVRFGLVGLLAPTLLGVYTQVPLVSLAIQAAVFALAAAYLASGAATWAGSRFLGWAALAVALLLGTSAFFSADRATSLMALGQWGALGVAGWLSASVLRPPHLRLLAQYLLLLGVLMAGLAVYFYWGEVGQAALPVMNSIFGNKNHFGGYLLLILPLALALLLDASSGRERVAYGAVAIFLGSTFVLSYSRGAWFAMMPALALVVWTFRRRPSTVAIRLALVGAGVVLAALLITRGGLGSTIDMGYRGALSVAQAASGGEAGDTLAPRLDYWQGAVRIMLDHPLAGAGLGTFDALFPSYELDPRYYSRFAHNFFLQMGAEAGIMALIALILMFGILAAGWARVYRLPDHPDGMPAALRAGLVAGLVASALHNLVELDWYIPAIGILFAVEAGLVLRASRPEPLVDPGQREERLGPCEDEAPRHCEDEGRSNLGVGLPRLRSAPARNDRHFPRRAALAVICAVLALAAAWQWSEQLLLTQADSAPDPSAARSRLEAAASLNPLDGEPEFRLAELHLSQYEATGSQDDLDGGIAAALEALSRSPARDSYRVILARFYLSAGKLDSAIEVLENLVRRLQPLQVPEAYRQLGEAYLKKGRSEDARAVYLRLLAGFPQGADTPQPPQPGAMDRAKASELLSEAHLALGNIHVEDGDSRKAEEEYQLAFLLDPGNAPASFNLGLVLYGQGRWAESLVRFQWASSLDWTYAPSYYYQGLAHLKLGQKRDAASDFEAALAADPNYEAARRALEEL